MAARNLKTAFEIEDVLRENLQGTVDDLICDLASYLFRPLSQEYKNMAKSVFQSKAGGPSATNRKSHAEFQDKISGLFANAKLFEKGLSLLDGDTQVHLCKYLLKSVCQDIVNLIFEMVAAENLLTLADNETFNSETRLKLLNKLSGSIKGPLTKLNSSLSAKSMDDFFNQLDVITGPEYCDVMLRKTDKKKERQLVFNHRQALIDELERETEPAMALHLVVILLFQSHTNCMLHAPGRCIPQIILYLQQFLTEEVFDQLNSYQALVMMQMAKKEPAESLNDAEEPDNNIGCLLAEGLLDIKKLAKRPKKDGAD